MDIRIEGLSKTYRGQTQALRDITLRIEPGMFGLLGPNGAGKTTLMRILAGVLRPTHGALWVGDHDCSTERGRIAVKRLLGYLPQDLGVYPDLSAHEFLDYLGLLKGLRDTQARQRRVEDLLEMVGLAEVAGRKLKGFSGGMKRRVGIAQALLNDPQLLIVDEPTAGLDPEERIHFRNLLADLGARRTVLLSTHIVEDIAQTCQRLAVMKSGQVVFCGAIGALVEAARGNVWQVTTTGAKPEGKFTVISTMRLASSAQYRVVGEAPPHTTDAATERVEPVEPGLEDGYVWLMREQRPSVLV